MTTTYRSLDEFKEAFGNKSEKLTKESSKSKHIEDKNKRKSSSVIPERKPTKVKPIKKGTMAAIVAEREAAQLKEKEKKKPVRLGYGIRCPRHGCFLCKGHKAIITITGKDEPIELFYCYDCKQYYFTSKKVKYGIIRDYKGKKAKNIQTSRYEWNRGEWECVEYNEPEIKTKEQQKGSIKLTSIKNSVEENVAKIGITKGKPPVGRKCGECSLDKSEMCPWPMHQSGNPACEDFRSNGTLTQEMIDSFPTQGKATQLKYGKSGKSQFKRSKHENY